MLAGGPLMPAVEIGLQGANGVAFRGLGLVDSGADCSMFPAAIAQTLGVDLASCAQQMGNDASGGSLRWDFASGIQATFEGRTIQLSGCFGGAPIILLGRRDFFSAFRQIAFNEKGRFFTISD